jgi:hypothetical protein
MRRSRGRAVDRTASSQNRGGGESYDLAGGDGARGRRTTKTYDGDGGDVGGVDGSLATAHGGRRTADGGDVGGVEGSLATAATARTCACDGARVRRTAGAICASAARCRQLPGDAGGYIIREHGGEVVGDGGQGPYYFLVGSASPIPDANSRYNVLS